MMTRLHHQILRCAPGLPNLLPTCVKSHTPTQVLALHFHLRTNLCKFKIRKECGAPPLSHRQKIPEWRIWYEWRQPEHMTHAGNSKCHQTSGGRWRALGRGRAFCDLPPTARWALQPSSSKLPEPRRQTHLPRVNYNKAT